MLNVIARQWYHCLLAGNFQNRPYDAAFILENLEKSHPGGRVTLFKSDVDFGYAVELDGRVEGVFRGTHGRKGWFSNFKFWPNVQGFHTGFYDGFMKIWSDVAAVLGRNKGKVVEWGGHSRGAPLSQLLAMRVGQRWHMYIKPIVFCPPRLCNDKGVRLFGESGMGCLNMVDANDMVDDVGVDVTRGKFFGDVIYLPESREFTLREKLLDLIPGWGHAPSEVTDGLVQYFYGRGLAAEAEYLKSIRHLANI
jgi:hypothetical protein